MKTLNDAINKMKQLGATDFQGTVENCGTITCYDPNGIRVGHIHASYDACFNKILVVKINNEYNA